MIRCNNYFCMLFLLIYEVNFVLGVDGPKSWTGRWFPSEPTTEKPKIVNFENDRAPMGVISSVCDDGKTNLTVDWDGSFVQYTCLSPRSRLLPNESVESLIEFENIPKAYMAPHFCMNRTIHYNHNLPTFGPHRPLWPVYGEYKFLPKQRWLHTLEHGGIVALFHPCGDLTQIKHFRKIIKNCLRQHILSPSRDVSKERPFAVLSWGVRFSMSVVNPSAITQFIQKHALKGPEKLNTEGQYDYELMEQAAMVSDFDDSNLCPNSI